MERVVTDRISTLALILLLAVGFAVVVPALASAAEGEAATLPQTKGWNEARTRNFVVYSDAGEGKARKIAVELEMFRLALGRISKAIVPDDRFPSSFFAFRNDLNFAPYKRDERGNPKNLSGYFIATPFRNYVALDTSAGPSPMRIVYHEYFHQLLAKTVPDAPLWLAEGLAELFRTFRTEDRGTIVHVGHPIGEHVAFLSERGMIPWEEVFTTTRESPAYNQAVRQGSFYAQSWLATHYMAATAERLRALGDYLQLLRDGAGDGPAFDRAFGMNRAKLAPAIDLYGGKIGGPLSIDLGEAAKGVEVAVRPLAAGEVYFRLGDLLAQRGEVEAVRRHLAAAKAAGWSAGEIEAILGSAEIAARDPREAEPHLRSAVAAGAASAEPYVLLGQLLLDRDWKKVGAASGLPAGASEARSLFGTALEKEADSLPALLGFARTFLFERSTQAGLDAVAKARKLQPSDGDALKLGACLLARGGQPAAAGAVVAKTIAPRRPEIAREASACVGSGAWTAAVERIKASEHAEASRIVAEALDVVRDPDARSRLEALGRIAESGGDVILSADDPDPALATYNEAVELTQAGKHEEALALLATVLKDCAAGKVCEAARDLDARLTRSIRRKEAIAGYNRAVDLVGEGKRVDAIILLRALEQEADEPDTLEKIRDFLGKLGQKPAAAKAPGAK